MHKKQLDMQAATSAQWYCTIVHNIQRSCTSWLFTSCQTVICLISFKVRSDPLTLLSLWIHWAGSQLFDLALVWSQQNFSASDDRTRGKHVWTALRGAIPLPSLHESFDLLSNLVLNREAQQWAFSRRWGLLRFEIYWDVLSAHAPKIVPYEVRLMSTQKHWWAPPSLTEALKLWHRSQTA